MSRRHLLVAAALLAVSGGAWAFVRETTDQSTPHDPAKGLCLWWGPRQVGFKVNATSAANPPNRAACPTCAPCQDEAAAAVMVAATLPTWAGATRSGEAQACTDFNFASGGLTTQTALAYDGVNLVVFRTGWCSSTSVVPLADPCRSTYGACAAKYNCWEHDAGGTIGLTTTTYRVSTGEILDADVEFHGWDGTASPSGFYLTCGTVSDPTCKAAYWEPPAPTGCTAIDVDSLSLHEAGHMLGLDHTCQYAAPYDGCPAASVMQPTIQSGTTRRGLDADDVAGVCTIYPKGGATLTCGSVAPPPSGGGGGCATGEGAGLLALGAAVAALLRGRRRSGSRGWSPA